MRLLLLGGLFCATLAEAQEAGRAPLGPAAAQRASLAAFLVPVVVAIAVISPDDASDGAVTAGRVIFFAGTLFGPAAGYWLGGAAGRGWLGVGIRAVITGATFALVDDDFGASYAATIGGVILLGHAMYDVARVKPITTGRQSPLRLGLSPAWVNASGIGLRVEW